jgi:hypothetical protein
MKSGGMSKYAKKENPNTKDDAGVRLTRIVLCRVGHVPNSHDDRRRDTDKADDEEHDPARPEEIRTKREEPYARNLHRVPAHGDRVELADAPHFATVCVLEALEPKLEVWKKESDLC